LATRALVRFIDDSVAAYAFLGHYILNITIAKLDHGLKCSTVIINLSEHYASVFTHIRQRMFFSIRQEIKVGHYILPRFLNS